MINDDANELRQELLKHEAAIIAIRERLHRLTIDEARRAAGTERRRPDRADRRSFGRRWVDGRV